VSLPHNDEYPAVLAVWQEYRLLLVADPAFPSVAGIVAGEPIAGSWWGHPLGHPIFEINSRLAKHPDVIVVKLISGKVTFVHRDLWSDLVSVATAREPWQMDGLSAGARWLFEKVTEERELHMNEVSLPKRAGNSPPGDAARELERRLLVHAEQFHSERGAHAKRLQTWQHWAKQAGFVPELKLPAESRQRFEKTLANLNERFGAKASLPWNNTSGRKRKTDHGG